MNAFVKFSTNIFIKDDVKPNIENEAEFSFTLRDWLLRKFDRKKFTFHLFPNGNFSIELYPEVIFIILDWNDCEINPEVEKWILYLEKEKYLNKTAISHSNETTSRENFLSICQIINTLFKNETKIYDICWTPSINLLEDFKLFAEICPKEI